MNLLSKARRHFRMNDQRTRRCWSSAFIVFILVISITGSIIQMSRFVWNPAPVDDELPQKKWASNDSITLNDKFEHIFWFLQISDLHLSINFDPNRGPDFERWCHEVIDTVKPKVTLVTGDLTDARTKGLMNGEQFEEEWMQYAAIVNRTKVTEKTLWLDIRGNHDDFGVFSWNSDNNYFRTYSVQGKHHNKHYIYTIKDGYEVYSFIAVDACLEPGPNRPFNTIGLLHQEDIDSIKELKKKASGDNMTIWFAHYPTRAITQPSPGLSHVINGPFLSGHVHITNLYAFQPPGFLDIELADWRAKRKFRIAAVDHGVFAFNDVVLDDWPLILITNPKPTAFLMPKLEPAHMIVHSTHIRVLVFSKSKTLSVFARIDGDDFKPMENVGDSPLFILPWTPKKYKEGLHTIEVKALDDSGERTVQHVFSFDGRKTDFSVKSKLIMTYMHQTVWGLAFILVVWFIVGFLMIFRSCVIFGKGTELKQAVQHSNNCIMAIVLKFYILACVDKVFIPTIIVPLYVLIGPWLVGSVIDGHFGISFVWGTFIDGKFLPGGVSYVLGVVFLLFIHVPLILVLANESHIRLRSLLHPMTPASPRNQLKFILFKARHLITLAVFGAHFFVSLIYGDAYGLVAWSLGIAHTWTLLLAIYVWSSTFRLELKDFRGFASSRGQTLRPEDAADLIEEKDRAD